MDISFGGSFFAIVKAEKLGLDISPANAQKINRNRNECIKGYK